MLKVKVTVPASCVGLVPGADMLGLALGLHDTLEFSIRADTQFVIEANGDYPASLRHPAMKAAVALFQRFERAPAGFSVSINSRIPVGCGLGDYAALTVGGLVAANNLIGTPLKREQVAEMAVALTGQPAPVVTSLFGGLTATVAGDKLLFRRLDTSAQKMILALPSEMKKPDAKPDRAAFAALSGRTALLIEAFRKNDMTLLADLLRDATAQAARLPGGVEAAARKAGALGVAWCGEGPALLAFATGNHREIEAEMQRALGGTKARTWLVNLDTQGVSVSVSG